MRDGLGGKVGITPFRRSTLDTSGADIILNAFSNVSNFNSSDDIAAAKSIEINTNSNTFEIRWRFTLSALPAPLEFENNVRMTDPLYDAGTNIWTPADLGEYELHGTFDGTNWDISIIGLWT